MVYALMHHRAADDYRYVLDILNVDSPEILLTDFELAEILALTDKYPMAKVNI